MTQVQANTLKYLQCSYDCYLKSSPPPTVLSMASFLMASVSSQPRINVSGCVIEAFSTTHSVHTEAVSSQVVLYSSVVIEHWWWFNLRILGLISIEQCEGWWYPGGCSSIMTEDCVQGENANTKKMRFLVQKCVDW